MYQIKMDTSSQYDIYIENGILDKINEYLGMVYHEKNVYIITDERVASFYLDRVCTLLIDYNVKNVVIKGYEESKVLETYADVCSQLIDLGISRNEMLIALGGGVIGDLVGFVAATLYRGVPFIQIPTSLLAQVDSSIGGKTGIDFKGRKNILGAFNQPKMVLIDPLVLMTLPEEQLKNGYGEMIKHALIGSKKLFNLLEDSTDVTEEIIYENLLVKKQHVVLDEFDKGERMKLNYGHTLGHIIEMKYNLLHGEAVLSGILSILDFTKRLGYDVCQLKDKVINLYQKYSLNYVNVSYNELVNEIHYDKKNIAGTINFILVTEIGKAQIYPIKEDDLGGYFN